MNVISDGRPKLVCPCVGVHRISSHVSFSSNSTQNVLLNLLNWGNWPYNYCFVGELLPGFLQNRTQRPCVTLIWLSPSVSLKSKRYNYTEVLIRLQLRRNGKRAYIDTELAINFSTSWCYTEITCYKGSITIVQLDSVVKKCIPLFFFFFFFFAWPNLISSSKKN